jgi:uncharacterized membrane protein
VSTRADPITPDTEGAEEPLPFVPRVFGGWRPIFVFIVCVGGVGVSIYLTIVHFEPQALVCTTNSFISCAPVLHSSQSVLFGIPVPFYGLFWFVSMVRAQPVVYVAHDEVVAAVGPRGVVGGRNVFRLRHDLRRTLVINKLCEWCTTVHVFTLGTRVVAPWC